MELKIWRVLVQILSFRNDLIDIIKPFIENLNTNNLNDEKYISFLKSFSKYHLEILKKYEIIKEERIRILNTPNLCNTTMAPNEIEQIIEGDKVEELQKFLLKTEFAKINTFCKNFNEVEKMEISIIHYCIMKNAIKCFKYLLVNGYSNPTLKISAKLFKNQLQYEWDCMAIAIYYGNVVIMKILEEKEIEKGDDISHLEAAILSYRNHIAKQIITTIQEKNGEINENILQKAIIASGKNNNIRGCELLIEKGTNLNYTDFNLY